MNRSSLALALVVLCAPLWAACHSAKSQTTSVTELSEEVVAQSLVLLDVRMEGTDPTRALRFTLRNTGAERVACRMRIEWINEQLESMPDGAGTYVTLDLAAGAQQPLEVAPVPVGCRSFRARFSAP